MSQDTRKDQRAKIVSLNVRYKSATVDEFIENHSHDVSKGGLFIKTATPFPPGTLLKFEIRIAGDKAVIAGVGRVVWKREPTQAGNERPAGMGVKFIKIDDNSRVVIDKLTGQKSDAGSAFDSEEAITGTGTDVASKAGASMPPAIVAGSAPPRPRISVLPGDRISAPPGERKATMMGIGLTTSTPPTAMKVPGLATHSIPPGAGSLPPGAGSLPPAEGAGMFPTSTVPSDAEAPREKTVMKQAAELLEEALKESGGSMDELGQNPLFGAVDPRPSPPSMPAAKSADVSPSAPPSEGPSTLIGLAAATPVIEPVPEVKPPQVKLPPESDSKVATPPKTPPKATGSTEPDTTPLVLVDSPETTRESPAAKSVSSPPSPDRSAATGRPTARRSVAPAVQPEPPAKKSKATMIVVLVALAAIVGGTFYAYQSGMLGEDSTPPAPSASAMPSATTIASTMATTATSATAEPTATAVDAATPAKIDAAVATTATAAMTTTSPKATATATVAPKPTATAAATATAAPKPTATATATAAATATAEKPKPTPKPKPAATDNDNPY